MRNMLETLLLVEADASHPPQIVLLGQPSGRECNYGTDARS